MQAVLESLVEARVKFAAAFFRSEDSNVDAVT